MNVTKNIKFYGGFMKNEKINKKVKSVIDAYTNNGVNKSDPEGSYTGRANHKQDKPEQDADDL